MTRWLPLQAKKNTIFTWLKDSWNGGYASRLECTGTLWLSALSSMKCDVIIFCLLNVSHYLLTRYGEM